MATTNRCHYYELYNEKSRNPILLYNIKEYTTEQFLSLVQEARDQLVSSKQTQSDKNVADYLIDKYKFDIVKYAIKP